MWRRFIKTVLWAICGIVFWHCAHTITLIFPLPGPWLPTEVAWVTGLIMGCLGYFLSAERLKGISLSRGRLFPVLGVVSGLYLGWIFARATMTQQERFLPPSETDRVLSALLCGGLGLAANWGTSWLMEKKGDRPPQVLYYLLCLLLLMLAAVALVIVSHEIPL